MSIRHRTRRRAAPIVAVLAVLLVAAGCGRGEDGGSPGISDDTIEIGGSFPFSGPLASFGNASRGFEAYLKSVNAEGGVDGRTFEYTALDDAYEPSRAVSNARRLVERDNVFAMVTFGSPAVSMLPTVDQSDTPMVVAAGNREFSNLEEHPTTRAWWPNVSFEGSLIADYALDEVENPRIGTLMLNTDVSPDMVDGIRQALGDRADEVYVAEQSYAPTDTDVSSQINELRRQGVNVLFTLATGAAEIQMVQYIRQIGWDPTIFLYSPASSRKSVLSQIGLERSEGLFSVQWLKDPSDPRWRDDASLREYFSTIERFGGGADPEDANTATGYGMAQAFVEAVRGMEEPTQEGLLQAWDDIRETPLPILQEGVPLDSGPGERLIDRYRVVRFDGDTWVPETEAIDAEERGYAEDEPQLGQ